LGLNDILLVIVLYILFNAEIDLNHINVNLIKKGAFKNLKKREIICIILHSLHFCVMYYIVL